MAAGGGPGRCGWFGRGEAGQAGAGPVARQDSAGWGGKAGQALLPSQRSRPSPATGRKPRTRSGRLLRPNGQYRHLQVIASLSGLDRLSMSTTCSLGGRAAGRPGDQPGLRTGNPFTAETGLSGGGQPWCAPRGVMERRCGGVWARLSKGQPVLSPGPDRRPQGVRDGQRQQAAAGEPAGHARAMGARRSRSHRRCSWDESGSGAQQG